MSRYGKITQTVLVSFLSILLELAASEQTALITELLACSSLDSCAASAVSSAALAFSNVWCVSTTVPAALASCMCLTFDNSAIASDDISDLAQMSCGEPATKELSSALSVLTTYCAAASQNDAVPSTAAIISTAVSSQLVPASSVSSTSSATSSQPSSSNIITTTSISSTSISTVISSSSASTITDTPSSANPSPSVSQAPGDTTLSPGAGAGIAVAGLAFVIVAIIVALVVGIFNGNQLLWAVTFGCRHSPNAQSPAGSEGGSGAAGSGYELANLNTRNQSSRAQHQIHIIGDGNVINQGGDFSRWRN